MTVSRQQAPAQLVHALTALGPVHAQEQSMSRYARCRYALMPGISHTDEERTKSSDAADERSALLCPTGMKVY